MDNASRTRQTTFSPPRRRRRAWSIERLEDRTLLTLVAAYSFDEAEGAVLHDLSGHGNNGAITNATWSSAGKFGDALSFTGVSGSWVTVPDSTSLHLSTGMTLEAWVDPTSLNSGDAGWSAAIAKEHRNSSNDISYALYAAAGTNAPPAGHVLIGSNDRGAQGGSKLAANAWAFLTTTYDGATLRTYVNGTQVASRSLSGAIFSTTDPLRIGGDWSGEMFTGQIDNVRIYDTGLAASQIQADMSVSVAPDTTPPWATIIAPIDGATVTGTITVAANAGDNVAVAGVQFQLDGTNLAAEVTTAPYSLPWNTATATVGAHTLTAIAYDTSGNSATSAPVGVTVARDTIPPSVAITAPIDGTTVSGTTTVAANAGDNVAVAGVQFQLDGIDLGAEVTTAPYSIAWDTIKATNAGHTLTAIAYDTSGNSATSAPVGVTVSNTGTNPLSVSITVPASGATVIGTTTLTATASDTASSVSGVQFLLDGANLGSQITTAPYKLSWDSTKVADGSHTIGAVARDAVGNSSTATVTIYVTNSAASIGQWAPAAATPIVAINMIQMDNGKILMLEGQGTTPQVFDPETGVFTPVPITTGTDLFCAGAAAMSDGRILVVGGHGTTLTGTRDVNIFDPATNTWTAAGKMAYARWYPTVTALPDGRMLALGGADATTTSYVPYPEVYDPAKNSWTTLTGASLASNPIPSYAHAFMLANGTVITTGASEPTIPTRTLDANAQTWTMVDPNVVDGTSSVMYRPGMIMKAGTASDSGPQPGLPAAATTYVLDTTQPNATWQQTASMNFPRATTADLVSLPDGNGMVFGGGTDTSGEIVSHAVLPAEEWSPATKTWTVIASMSVPRLYHSTTLLLPDGRVLESGSGGDPGTPDELSYQIYSANYLFKGARPTVTSAPTTAQTYGGSFFVGTPDAANIASVVLIRPGAVTHGFDQDQRHVPLTFTQTAGGLTVNAPANANLAPPAITCSSS
jgi:hypothetical protein